MMKEPQPTSMDNINLMVQRKFSKQIEETIKEESEQSIESKLKQKNDSNNPVVASVKESIGGHDVQNMISIDSRKRNSNIDGLPNSIGSVEQNLE